MAEVYKILTEEECETLTWGKVYEMGQMELSLRMDNMSNYGSVLRKFHSECFEGVPNNNDCNAARAKEFMDIFLEYTKNGVAPIHLVTPIARTTTRLSKTSLKAAGKASSSSLSNENAAGVRVKLEFPSPPPPAKVPVNSKVH